jgi:hypothetical protein
MSIVILFVVIGSILFLAAAVWKPPERTMPELRAQWARQQMSLERHQSLALHYWERERARRALIRLQELIALYRKNGVPQEEIARMESQEKKLYAKLAQLEGQG